MRLRDSSLPDRAGRRAWSSIRRACRSAAATGCRYPGRAGWRQPYRRWLPDLSVPLAPQHIALREYRDTIDETERRVDRLTEPLRQHAPAWRWAPVVEAWKALRGVSFVTGLGRLLAEAACAYQGIPRIGRQMLYRQEALPKVATAVARELTGVIWAIAREVSPPAA